MRKPCPPSISRRSFLCASALSLTCPSFGEAADSRYGRVAGERFAIPAVNLARIGKRFLRTEVRYDTDEEPGVIVVDPDRHFLYRVEDEGRATRYGVGVGREGFGWSGEAVIHDKQEWPDWYPPEDMLDRDPSLMRSMSRLRGGLGMRGGPRNPLGARAMYLWQDGKDTLYRIHGTNEPWSIGRSLSSGCIRMIDQDAIDLYDRTPVGTKVVVLPSANEDFEPDLDGLPNDIVRDRRRMLERGLF